MFAHFKKAADAVSTVLVIAAAVALLWNLYRPTGRAGGPPRIESIEDLSVPGRLLRNVRGGGRVMLVEFSDYECPFCTRHARTTAPRIRDEFIEPQRIQHVFLNYPLSAIHPHAQKAGEAAGCAARQGRFWAMHEALFERSPKLTMEDLVSIAAAVGLDEPEFTRCLQQSDTADEVHDDFKEGERLGVDSTPVFFVGVPDAKGAIVLIKRIKGAAPFETLAKAINDTLTDADGPGNGRVWWKLAW